MIYCMSDIHGELDRFKAMLDLINFSSDDTLYIIGDVIDRHPGGVEILKIIKDTPNMFMLLGNHEQMCLDTLGPNSVYGSRRLWLENGGSNTYRELLYVCSLAERSRIIHFLSTLPDHFDVEVGDRKFHLVHAMPSDDPDDRIWRRPKPDDPPYFEDRIAVVGHTQAPDRELLPEPRAGIEWRNNLCYPVFLVRTCLMISLIAQCSRSPNMSCTASMRRT